jgi:hypothetical protein
MNETDIHTELLFSRLVHPSGMVRERACTQIAHLMAISPSNEAIRDRLLSWMSEQRLESISIVGLLVLHRLRTISGVSALPAPEKVRRSVNAPSLLSYMILKELFGEEEAAPDWETAYSGYVSPSFSADPFFEKYVKNFLPPAYWSDAISITQRRGIDFVFQWSWEWSKVVQSVNVNKDTNVFSEWGRPDDKHYVAVDSLMSEVYRSSYLRALAWALDNNLLRADEAEGFAAQACPIDLALWSLALSQQPSWVPRIEAPKGAIDTTHSEVWAKVQQLWENGSSHDGMVIGQACLPLLRGKNLGIDLAIFGVLQSVNGPAIPDLSKVVTWCKYGQYLGKGGNRPLYFGGELEPMSPSGFEHGFDDWTLWPTTVQVSPVVAPRWQWWRMYRGLWFPSLFILPAKTSVCVTKAKIEFLVGKDLVGYWSDWIVGLREMRMANLPPPSGQALWLSRRLLRQIEDKEGLRFCWVCEVQTFHRKYSHEKFREITTQRQFGASLLVKP